MHAEEISKLVAMQLTQILKSLLLLVKASCAEVEGGPGASFTRLKELPWSFLSFFRDKREVSNIVFLKLRLALEDEISPEKFVRDLEC